MGSKYTLDAYEKQMIEKSLRVLDDDLALIVVLASLSNDAEKIIKSFKIACQMMSDRAAKKTVEKQLDEFDEKIIENTTFLLSRADDVIKNSK